MQTLSIDENANWERDTIGNEVHTSGVEVEECHQDKQQLLLNDLSGAAVSTQLQENHNPDNGSNPGIDQNRTPQQKPRRRKHRPKVVIEGQPKRTRKPAAPQPTGPKENPKGKRKYVRKNKLEKIPGTPSAEVTSGPTDSVPAERTTKSCRRTLNFDSESQVREESSICGSQSDTVPESQAQNLPTRVLSKSNVQLDQGMEVMVEKTQVGIAYELVQSMNKVLQDYISMPERQDPIPKTPTKTDPPNENWKTDVQNEHAGGKCQIVFSDGSACLTEGDQVKGLKRGNSCMNYDAEARRADLIGAHYSSSHGYLGMFPANVYNYYGIPNICFPGIYKKMRFEKGHSLTTSSILSSVTTAETNVRLRQVTPRPLYNGCAACSLSAACSNTSSTSTKIAPLVDAPGSQQAFECKLGMDQKGRMEKRSKGPARVCNLSSQVDIIEGIRLQTFQAEGAPTSGNMQGYEILDHPYTCMEGLIGNTHTTMTTNKRTKTNYSADSVTTDMYNQSLVNSTDAVRKRIPWIHEILEHLKNLDITNQQQSALVPYNLIYGEQSSLVLYKRDATVVPFGGSFNPVRKRRPRPKVDLDDETSRVWKLLLDNINSEGIDGTDEEKVKWWEEERRVFRGRADSFIARMHLVQGDRRFSPWKGSVVDSVVGVFLTQNVSDHLSSSAFMSVASRFPLKPKSKDSPCFGETSVLPNEPDVCILDPQNTIIWQQHKEKSNQPALNGNSIAFHHMDCYSEKVVNNNEFLGSSSTGGKSLDSLKCKCSDISANVLEMYHESTANRAVIQLKESVASFTGDKREVDDVQSSQHSGDSSQNSLDSSMAQTAERIGSCLLDNFEAADLTARSKPNSQLSFMELLLQAESLRSRKSGYKSSFKENRYSCMESTAHNMQNQNKGESDNPTRKPMIPSHLQMPPTSGMLEVESFKMVGEDIPSSDNSTVSEENCTSEQSGVTAESVTQAMIQKTVTASFREASKSPCENNHACSSLQRGMDKIFQSQNRQVGNPKDNVHSQTQEHDCRMQEVEEIPDVSRETLDITESTNVINDPKITEHKKVESSLTDHCCLPGKAINGTSSDSSKVKKGRTRKQEQNNVDWDSLRLQAQEQGKRERTTNTMDSLDWEAVWRADVNELAETIKERGMNNRLAERIKDFLNRLVKDHGSIDLEWLRDVPPDKAKEYLLSIKGLGLKSVECVRLLTLHHLAFPVDTNVGRIAVRLGWVPLQPLPESLQLHLLELYPVLESIQRYLWPRLCKLDQRTLYELHYQMITFGKVFCTKSKPNCNACPLRGECRHFASAFASARLALPGPEEKSIVSAIEKKADNENLVKVIKPLPLPLPQSNQELQAQSRVTSCEPIIEEPASPEPIVEVPATPEHEQPQVPESDIEDAIWEDPEEIPLIKLNIEEFTQNLQNYMQRNMELQEGDVSKALVALTPEAASIPTPKLKNVNRLRTEHQVYELPDSHPLLEGLDKREPDDPCPYLLAIWTPGETADSIQPPEIKCTSQEFGKLCDQKECFSCNSIREANGQTVRGTLLIPCRTAMRGSFPLNGTYFQVNEVFADHESSICPIDVPRAWLWNLPRRTVYFGTSMPSIFKGLSTEGIQYCFWRGFVCVRGFDQKTRAPRPLMARLHFPVSKLPKTKGTTNDKQETKGKISDKQE